MPLRTFGDAKASRLPKVIGACPTDQRFADILNEAEEMLLNAGHYWGTIQKYRFCAQDNCITYPPQVATVEAAAACGMVIPVRDLLYEFMENGYGPINSNGTCGACGVPGAIFRGNYPTYLDIVPTGKVIKLVCDVAADVGKPVLLLGYDDSGNWIRTVQGGSYADGEVVLLSQAGTLSVSHFSSLSGVQLPSNSQGQSWLYEYNVATSTPRLLANYQYFETRPNYPRYYLPSIYPGAASGTCKQVLVETLVKLAFIPVKNDTDYLIISNFPALKLMMMALNAAEHEPDSDKKVTITMSGLKAAMAVLDQELDHYLGTGRKMTMNVIGSSLGQVDPVVNLM